MVGKDDLEIIDKLKNQILITFYDMEKLSISNILTIIKNCNLYIGNDTGFHAHECCAWNKVNWNFYRLTGLFL